MATTIKIEIDESTLKKLIKQYLEDQIGTSIDEKDIKIETKSKQNYSSEWESAAFRASIHKYTASV